MRMVNRAGKSAWWVTSLVVTMTTAGCAEDPISTGGDNGVPQCSARNTISVSTTPSVRISWSPACAAGGLGVVTEDYSTPMWGISSSPAGAVTLEGPVEYGQVPPGAVEGFPAAPLQSGVRYRVLLSGAAMGAVAPLATMGTFTMP